MQTLKGRTCIFAGGSGGDGVDTAKALCAGGMNVVLMTHQAAQAQTLVEEIRSASPSGTCIAVEGTNGPAETDPGIMAQVAKRFGSVDVMISNIGADGKKEDIETLDVDEMLKNMDHLVGESMGMLQTALPYLKKSQAPRVILMTTVEGCIGGTHESLSNAIAKGAIRAMALNCADRLAQYGITVNAISKGAIPRTVGYIDPDAPKPEEILDRIPIGRIGSPKDLAQAVCFLASEESSFVTGQILYVAGGLQLGGK